MTELRLPPLDDLEAGAGGLEAPTEHASPDRLRGLDGLRGLAALAVLTTHVAFATGRYGDPRWGALLSRLEVGVAVFFALSGFLLSRPWFEAAAGLASRPRTAAYLWRRGLRILPAYWLAVAAAFLLLPANADVTSQDWLRNLLLVQVYTQDWNHIGLSQMWSLSTEVAFYLVLPLLAAAVLHRLRRTGWRLGPPLTCAAALVVLGLATSWLSAVPGGPLPGIAGMWLLAHAGWFGAGIALAAMSVHARAGRPTSRALDLLRQVAAQPASCWVAAGALLWFAATPLAGPATLEASTASAALISEALYLAVATLLLLPLVLGPGDGLLPAVVGSTAARRLGDLSYGIFLYHLIVLQGVMTLLDQREFQGSFSRTLLLTAAGAWLAAALSYRFLEQPVMRLRRLVPAVPRTPRRRRPVPAA